MTRRKKWGIALFIAVMSVVMSAGYFYYQEARRRADFTAEMSDKLVIRMRLIQYAREHGVYPSTLQTVVHDGGLVDTSKKLTYTASEMAYNIQEQETLLFKDRFPVWNKGNQGYFWFYEGRWVFRQMEN